MMTLRECGCLGAQESNLLLKRYAPRMPLPLLHPTIQSMASKIFTNSNDVLRESHVILESKIRELSELSLHGAKLFDEALKPREGTLS